MASLPRTSTVSQTSSTLNNLRERQLSEPTEKEASIPRELPPVPASEGEIAYPPTSSTDHTARKPPSSDDATSESITRIVGGFVAGIALAISHHTFLALLNGRNIDDYPQYWVKNVNNAFSALFSMCITFVATCALIQMKWNVARSRPLSIRAIDNLFALPSPSALLTIVMLTRLRSLRLFLVPIAAAVFTQSVALVSIFAPNALTVAPSAEIWRDILVPTLDLSKGHRSLEMIGQYTSPPQLWTTVLTSIMLQPPLRNWKIPLGCGATCKFDLVYDGPGLQCMDTPLEPLPYTPPPYDDFTSRLFYNATSTLYQNPGVGLLSLWEIEDQYELRIGYIATDGAGRPTRCVGSVHDAGSVYCVFRNATYKASFQMENNTMQVDHKIQSYGDILGTVKYGESDKDCSRNPFVPCFEYGVNTRAICDVFALAFTGRMQFDISSEQTGGVNVAVTDLLFSHAPMAIGVGFRLAVFNLSESLVSLFSNLTLGFIPHRNDTTMVRAELWDGSYAWSYTVWILWVVYLPTVILASLVILSGLRSIRSNKRGMDDKFSNFLLATKDIELDDVRMNVDDFAELQQLRLLYNREKGTFSVAPSD